MNYKTGFLILVVMILVGVTVSSRELTFDKDDITISIDLVNSSGLWEELGSELVPQDTGLGLKIPSLVNCDTIDTDANGVLQCGTDGTGAGADPDKFGNDNFTALYDARSDRFSNENFTALGGGGGSGSSLWNSTGNIIYANDSTAVLKIAGLYDANDASNFFETISAGAGKTVNAISDSGGITYTDISITESQISDLQSYLTSESDPIASTYAINRTLDEIGDEANSSLLDYINANSGSSDVIYDNSNFTSNYDSRADRFGNANFTALTSGWDSSNADDWNAGNLTTLYPNLDTDSTDDFDGAYSSLTGVPALSNFQISNFTSLYDSRSDRWQISNTSSYLTANGYNSSIDLSNYNHSVMLSWNNLADIPAGFADGVDDTGAGGGGSANWYSDGRYVSVNQSVSQTPNVNISGNLSVGISDDVKLAFDTRNSVSLINSSQPLVFNSSSYAFSGFTNCNLDTNADGQLVCGTDATGTGGTTYNLVNFTTNFELRLPELFNLGNLSTAYPNLDTDSTDDFDGAYSSLTGVPALSNFQISNFTALYDARGDRWQLSNVTALGYNSSLLRLSQFENDIGVGGGDSDPLDIVNQTMLDNDTILRTGNLTNAVCIALTGSADLCDGSDDTAGAGTDGFSDQVDIYNNITSYLGGTDENASLLRAENLGALINNETIVRNGTTYTILGTIQHDVWETPENQLTLTASDDGSNHLLTSSVGGTNYLEIATAGTFLNIYANPGPANDDLMFSFAETQGASTYINFYEGGTANNRFWSSGSGRFGGAEGSQCTTAALLDIDCDTGATGADVEIQDDLWVGGTIFSGDGDWSNVSITESQISDLQAYLTASPFGADINDEELANEDFGEFTCDGSENGCTLDTGTFDDEYIELGDSHSNSGGEATVTGAYNALVVTLSDTALDDQYILQENTSIIQSNATTSNFKVIEYNSSCTGFIFGTTGGPILSCE